MILPVIPKDTKDTISRSLEVQQSLKHKSKEQLIQEELDKLLDWENQKHPTAKRILHLFSIVYTKSELKDLVKRDIETYIVDDE